LLKVFFTELFSVLIMITFASEAFAVCTSDECKTAVNVYRAQIRIGELNDYLFRLGFYTVNADNLFPICKGLKNLSESLNNYNTFISKSLTKSQGAEMSEKEKGLLIPVAPNLDYCENNGSLKLFAIGGFSESDFRKVKDDTTQILQDQRQRVSQSSTALNNF
jgi:hypothetical protein